MIRALSPVAPDSTDERGHRRQLASAVNALQKFVAIPVGYVARVATAAVPDGWLACNGAAVSRTTYVVLFNAIGTTYGVGDGTTTFNVPTIAGTPQSIIKT